MPTADEGGRKGMNQEQLIQEAKEMRDKAYVPYSNFRVGAALKSKSGVLYTGCNIENAAFPVSCCAERVAIFKAISEGETAFEALAVAADTPGPVSPCGSCRQVMSEFFDEMVQIHLVNMGNNKTTVTVENLLPFSFQSDDMTDTR